MLVKSSLYEQTEIGLNVPWIHFDDKHVLFFKEELYMLVNGLKKNGNTVIHVSDYGSIGVAQKGDRVLVLILIEPYNYVDQLELTRQEAEELADQISKYA